MAIPDEFLLITKPMPGPMSTCPACQVKGLIRKTRDADSPFLGDVSCPACGYLKTREEWMAVWKTLKDSV